MDVYHHLFRCLRRDWLYLLFMVYGEIDCDGCAQIKAKRTKGKSAGTMGYYDGRGIYRTKGEGGYDARGYYRTPGEGGYDYSGYYRAAGEGGYDARGYYRSPGEGGYDSQGYYRDGFEGWAVICE